jgi:EF hand domain-containing protein
MKKHVLMFTILAFIVASGAAVAEEGASMRGPEGHAMIGQGGVMGCGMMGRGGVMGGGMMGRGVAMRFIFALMDSDGDGTVSLQEFQAAHEKIFKAMDTDKDGTLTLEEIQAFMRGPGKSAPKEHEHERE